MTNLRAQRMAACGVAILSLFAPAVARGQLNQLTREELIKYTARNPYERFPDGRPKVPDSVLEQLQELSSEDLLGVWTRSGANLFVDGFQLLRPGKKLIGRAFTLQMMPIRPEIAEVDAAEWKAKGNPLRLSHQSALDLLGPGDVIVIDMFGSPEAGGAMGNNLAYYVWKRTGTGFVVDGAIRDLQEVATYDMAGYFRMAVPQAIRGVMVTGINVPVRIGKTTVLPGDVVFGDREGVTFIPPHLVQGAIDTAKITHIHDEWTKKKFDENKYKSSDIYSSPHDPALIQEYEEYLKQRLGPQAYDEYKKRRQARPPVQPAKPGP